MNSFNEHILQLLSATGYDLQFNPERLSVTESPFTLWFIQNVSRENCITEEELTEFQLLQESGEVLYGQELDEALQEYNGIDDAVPVVGVFEDIKRDEAEHAQHQLHLQKQLASALRTSLNSLQTDYQDLQQHFRIAEAKQICVLKHLMAANTEFNAKLNIVKETLNSLVKDVMELAPSQELSADEGIYTYSSDKFKSSSLSNSSILSTVSSASNKAESNSKFICQMSFHKYNKQHTKFCKLLKYLLMKHLNKMLLKENTPNASLLLQNIMDRLFQQKQMYVKLSAKLSGINTARNKVKETKREIQCHLWNPNQSTLRIKITELDECNNLNDSETSFTKDEVELVEVCKMWADLQILKPICEGLQERIEHEKCMLQKLEELASIMNVRLAIDIQLCNKMYFEYDLVSNIMEIYTKVRDWLDLRVEGSKTRMTVMKENLQDYNEHFVNARRELVEYLALVLGCDKTRIPEAYNLLVEHSHEYHQQFIQTQCQKLHTLASVHKDLKDFYFEEEENKSATLRSHSNQEHFDSIRQTLEVISGDIESANELCYTLLENKENIAHN